ncbi:Myb-like DNA-binding domain-containing protein [Gottfriedia luciferensis]|uniref:Myb-like DNA-binding domain-containing protein n=1 Tax=Gottfriedia luciferensis TaxID=178774 RepID=UPI000B441252|nr:Myb-like DNA-binding domain-containing protein [Gottfriedia luciferensis]
MNAQKTKWSQEDENTLIELVEKYVKKGKSKQEAFEMVANIVNRTKAACASRYRILTKSQHFEEKEINKVAQFEINLDTIIQYLINFDHMSEQNIKLKENIYKLKIKNAELNERLTNLKNTIQQKQKVLKNLAIDSL